MVEEKRIQNLRIGGDFNIRVGKLRSISIWGKRNWKKK